MIDRTQAYTVSGNGPWKFENIVKAPEATEGQVKRTMITRNHSHAAKLHSTSLLMTARETEQRGPYLQIEEGKPKLDIRVG